MQPSRTSWVCISLTSSGVWQEGWTCMGRGSAHNPLSTEEIEKKLNIYHKGAKIWKMLIFCQVEAAFPFLPRKRGQCGMGRAPRSYSVWCICGRAACPHGWVRVGVSAWVSPCGMSVRYICGRQGLVRWLSG